MEVNKTYLIDARSIFENDVPPNYPPSISGDDVDPIIEKRVGDIIQKAQGLHYPFVTLAIAEIGEGSNRYKVFEGAFFLKYTMLFLSKNLSPSIDGKAIANPHFYALDISDDVDNHSFKPFFEGWIKNSIEKFKNIKYYNNLISLINAINPIIEKEQLTDKMYVDILNDLLNKIPKEEQKTEETNIKCIKKQLLKLKTEIFN